MATNVKISAKTSSANSRITTSTSLLPPTSPPGVLMSKTSATSLTLTNPPPTMTTFTVSAVPVGPEKRATPSPLSIDILNLMPEVFGIKIAGPAGAGSMSAGETLVRAFTRAGYYCQGYPEYPSLIKGGHTSSLVPISEKPFPNNAPRVDLLLALTQGALDNEHQSIAETTHVIADQTLKADHEHKNLHQPTLLTVAKNAGNPLPFSTKTKPPLTKPVNFRFNIISIWTYPKPLTKPIIWLSMAVRQSDSEPSPPVSISTPATR